MARMGAEFGACERALVRASDRFRVVAGAKCRLPQVLIQTRNRRIPVLGLPDSSSILPILSGERLFEVARSLYASPSTDRNLFSPAHWRLRVARLSACSWRAPRHRAWQKNPRSSEEEARLDFPAAN